MEFSHAVPVPPPLAVAVIPSPLNADKVPGLLKSDDLLEKLYFVYNRALDIQRRGQPTRCSVDDVMRLGNLISNDQEFLHNDVYVEYEGDFDTSRCYSFSSRNHQTNAEFLRITIHL